MVKQSTKSVPPMLNFTAALAVAGGAVGGAVGGGGGRGGCQCDPLQEGERK